LLSLNYIGHVSTCCHISTLTNNSGPDYHLLLRKSFLERLDETYRVGKCDDYVWLCRLFVVFALGELYSQGASKSMSGHSVPGTGYFIKAMSLFEDLYDEPTIDYIETLLVIVSKPLIP
jgi:proline utilization trans-activator